MNPPLSQPVQIICKSTQTVDVPNSSICLQNSLKVNSLCKTLNIKDKLIQNQIAELSQLKQKIVKLQEELLTKNSLINKNDFELKLLKTKNETLYNENINLVKINKDLNYKLIELNNNNNNNNFSSHSEFSTHRRKSENGSENGKSYSVYSINYNNNNNYYNICSSFNDTLKEFELEIQNSKLMFENLALKTHLELSQKAYDFEVKELKRLNQKEMENYKDLIKRMQDEQYNLSQIQEQERKMSEPSASSTGSVKIKEEKSEATPKTESLFDEYCANNVDISEFTTQIDKVYSDFSKTKEKNMKMKEMISQKDILINQLKTELESKEEIIYELTNDYNELNDQFNTTLADTKKTNEIVIDQLRKENEFFKGKVKSMEGEIMRKEKAIKENRTKNRDLNLKLNELYEEIFALKRKKQY